MKRVGKISFNDENNRYGILNNMDLWENEGLHCGNCLEVFVNGEWINDRIEMRWNRQKDEYYLVNSKLTELEGLKVKY